MIWFRAVWTDENFRPNPRRGKMAIGDPAPNFSKHDFMNGGTYTLSDHLGDVILLAFLWDG